MLRVFANGDTNSTASSNDVLPLLRGNSPNGGKTAPNGGPYSHLAQGGTGKMGGGHAASGHGNGLGDKNPTETTTSTWLY